jgi:hypothetical protein
VSNWEKHSSPIAATQDREHKAVKIFPKDHKFTVEKQKSHEKFLVEREK